MFSIFLCVFFLWLLGCLVVFCLIQIYEDFPDIVLAIISCLILLLSKTMFFTVKIFLKSYFLTQNMVYLGECYMWIWKDREEMYSLNQGLEDQHLQMGHVWPMTCFWKASELRMGFAFFKGCKTNKRKWRKEDTQQKMYVAGLKYLLLSGLLQKQPVHPCYKSTFHLRSQLVSI